MLSKMGIPFAFMAFAVLLLSCSSDDDNNQNTSCGTTCAIPVGTGEFPATVPSGIVGFYTLTYYEVVPGGPFSDGDTAEFEITSDNKLTVTFNGNCVTIENPILYAEGTTEANFRDNCVFNVMFGASETNTGAFNEINVATLEFQFLGQFDQ